MGLTRQQERDLDRWIMNGGSWQDPDDGYEDYDYLDEDDNRLDPDDADDERFIDTYND